jgi:hypothetical protein
MKPIETAILWCEEHDDNFESELENHLCYGWVYSGDDAFVMTTEENLASLLRPDLKKSVDNDTWFVYLYAGNLRRVLELIPHNNKYVAFRRDNGPIKFYETKKLLRKLEIL